MQARLPEQHPRRSAAAETRHTTVALCGAIVALLLGVLTYAVERGGEVAFLSALNLEAGRRVLPRLVSGSLPSMLHTMAFSLATGAVLRAPARRSGSACVLWLVLGSALELVQHPAVSDRLAGLAGASWIGGRHLLRYASAGTFDVRDLTAVAAGAVIAHLLLRASVS